METYYKKVFWFVLLLVLFFCIGCGDGESDSKDPDPCYSPTAENCLDSHFYNICWKKNGVSFEKICEGTLEEHVANETQSQAFVPELTGETEEIERRRKAVIHHDQPALYVFGTSIPFRYTFRGVRNDLLNINDGLLNEGGHSLTFQDLDLSLNLQSNNTVPLSRLPSNAVQAPLPPPTMNPQPESMFDGISYTNKDVATLLDVLFSGKVAAWNENGLKIESCEEYVFEKYYDFTLFKDFATLHNDDHYRITEYAFRDVSHDVEYIDFESNIGDGALGAKVLHTIIYGGSTCESNVFYKKGTAEKTDEDMIFGEPTAKESCLKAAFKDLHVYYNSGGLLPKTAMVGVSHLNYDPLANHEFSKNQGKDGYYYYNPNIPGMDCYGNCEQRDLIPKNFFLEVMGKIDLENTNRGKGIVLTNDDLKAVYNQPDFKDAALADIWGYSEDGDWSYDNQADDWGYDNNWRHHLIMFEAAKRQYPNSEERKQMFLKFSLLRKHLVELLAERAFWEKKLMPIITDPGGHISTAEILTTSETLSLYEKEHGRLRVDELNADAELHYVIPNDSGMVVVPNFAAIDRICAALDLQIETVLLEAKSLGSLETDRDPSLHNYPIIYTVEHPNNGTVSISYDLSYDKVMSDWTPENFTNSALKFLPDETLDKTYAECRRVTAGNFAGLNADNFIFRFPADCSENSYFDVWHPWESRNYSTDTNKFRKFIDLITLYPKALIDCDGIIAGQVEKELEEKGMNYFDPVSGEIMMSKSSSYFERMGGAYAGLEFGYALGWLYEGYDKIPDIKTDGISSRDFVCENTNFFTFGNYFATGSFLKHDFVLASAGSYASNKTVEGARPRPPTLASADNSNRINQEMDEVASVDGVSDNSFLFIKNEKMTYSYDGQGNWNSSREELLHSAEFSGVNNTLTYNNDEAIDAQMLSIKVEKSVPICGIISVTIKGSLTGDIDADTYVNGDNAESFAGDRCKSMNFGFIPHMDIDGYAQASVTAGIPGVGGVSAGIDIGIKFIGIRFPYNANLFVSQNSSDNLDEDKPFNYDIHAQVFSNLDQEVSLLSGYFGAFVEIDYFFGSETYRQTLFSWDGYNYSGNLDQVAAKGEKPVKIPLRALYTLSQDYLNDGF